MGMLVSATRMAVVVMLLREPGENVGLAEQYAEIEGDCQYRTGIETI